MGGATSKNVAEIVTNSRINIVTDESSKCNVSTTAVNYNQIEFNVQGNNNDVIVDIDQNADNTVSLYCTNSSEIVNRAATQFTNTIDQTAEALNAGLLGSAEAENSISIVQNLDSQVLTTTSKECSYASDSANIITGTYTFCGDNNNIRMTLQQSQNNNNTSECVNSSSTMTTVINAVENTITQTASATTISGILILAIAFLIIMVAVVLGLWGYKKYGGWVSLVMIIVTTLLMLGGVLLAAWIFQIGLFAPPLEPLNPTDVTYDPETGKYICEDKAVDGFNLCSSNFSGSDNPFMAYGCLNDKVTFQNYGIDWDFYYQEANWDKLPPQVFVGVNCRSQTNTILENQNTLRTVDGGTAPDTIPNLCEGEEFETRFESPEALQKFVEGSKGINGYRSFFSEQQLGLCCGPNQKSDGYKCVNLTNNTVTPIPSNGEDPVQVDPHDYFECSRNPSGFTVCKALLKGTYHVYNFTSLQQTFTTEKEYQDTINEAQETNSDLVIRDAARQLLHKAVIRARWAALQSVSNGGSPYDLAWVGNGVTTSQWQALQGGGSVSVPSNAIARANPTGHLCLSNNDLWLFESVDPTLSNLQLYGSAEGFNLVGYRTTNTEHCVGSTGGASRLNFGTGFSCADSTSPSGVFQNSMCCNNGGLPGICEPYAAYEIPFMCSTGTKAEIVNHFSARDDFCGPCRGFEENGDEYCRPWQLESNNPQLEYLKCGVCLKYDPYCKWRNANC